MSSTELSTDSLDRALGQLRELVVRGFRFVHPRDSDGAVLAVVGVRPHGGVLDVIVLHSESDAKAMRLPGDEKDVLDPRNVLWETTGPAPDVLAELLSFSETQVPGWARNESADVTSDGAPSTGCWIPVAPGATRWLMSTA